MQRLNKGLCIFKLDVSTNLQINFLYYAVEADMQQAQCFCNQVRILEIKGGDAEMMKLNINDELKEKNDHG